MYLTSVLNTAPISLETSPETSVMLPRAQPKAWDYAHLALFCKLEVQMERAFRMPVRLRLGDVPYVDWLEGKRRGY